MICCFIWDVVSCFLYGKRVKETIEKEVKYREKDDEGRRYSGDSIISNTTLVT